MLAKLRWTKNPCGTRVSKTQVPIDHLLPSFFFSFFLFFFFLCLPSQDSSSPYSYSLFFFSFLKHPNPFLKIPNPKFTISGPKRHRFDDLSTEVAWVCWSRHQRSVFCVFWFGLSLDSFSVFSRLILLWNIFCCGFVFSRLIY